MNIPALICFAFALLLVVFWVIYSMIGGLHDDARLSFTKKFKNHAIFGEIALIPVVLGILLLFL